MMNLALLFAKHYTNGKKMTDIIEEILGILTLIYFFILVPHNRQKANKS